MNLTKIFVLIIFTTISFSQENKDLKVIDSLTINNNSIDKLLFQLDEFEFFRNLTEQKRSFSPNKENVKLWLSTSFDLYNKSSFENSDITPGYLHSPLYDKYLEDSKLNPFRTALGMIQAGAVGYLAYRHIKKWVIKN